MADTQNKILEKYGVDITQDNILKLYKVESAGITSDELEEKISACRKRWNQSINGANEKNAERDRARLEKADKFEAILRDKKLRKELIQYYSKSDGKPQGQGAGSPGNINFAKEYFCLIATTKKIKPSDVKFFFDYYQDERKNKKAILDMLSKDYKVIILGKDAGTDDKEIDLEGKKKKSGPMIVNLFQEATILKIKKCVSFYETACSSNELCQRYPSLRDGLFDFLELKNIETVEQFAERVQTRGKEVFADRQERGTEYVPLVDLFNTLQSMSEYQDVVDNFSKFKILLKYPNLTPYMYSFVEMKPKTLKGILDVANRDYVFRDDVDFILNYYTPIHDNFGISDSGISALIKKAEKKATSNKLMNDIDEKLGRKKKRKISIGAEIIHWLVYWPIVAIYFIFEVFKAIFTEIHRLAIPASAVVFIGTNWLMPKLLGVDNLLIIRKVFVRAEWYAFLDEFLGETIGNGFEAIVLSLIAIVFMLAAYSLPAVVVWFFISGTADDLNKRFDWVGIERTFQNIFQNVRKKTEDEYVSQKKLYVKNRIPKILINFVSVAMLAAIIYYVPVGLLVLSEKTGYGQKDEISEKYYHDDNEDEEDEKDEMVITVDSANIRTGAGKDYDVITVASKGDVFIATGNKEKDDSDKVWYEIFLDNKQKETGWASKKVIKVKK